MKKSTLESIRNYLNGDTTVDVDAMKQEVEAEYSRLTEKAQQNAVLYATALDVVLTHLTDDEVTANELFALCADELPDDFTQGKMNYLLRQHADKINVHRNGRSVNTYTKV